MTRGPRDGEGYMLWLEERWDAHKLDLHYSNGEREEKRIEEVLEMFKGLGELSRRGGGAAAIPAVGGLVMGNLMVSPSREMEHSMVQSDRAGTAGEDGSMP